MVVFGGSCQPQFKRHTMIVNANYSGWHLDDAWPDNEAVRLDRSYPAGFSMCPPNS
jgi:hypothetical protein